MCYCSTVILHGSHCNALCHILWCSMPHCVTRCDWCRDTGANSNSTRQSHGWQSSQRWCTWRTDHDPEAKHCTHSREEQTNNAKARSYTEVTFGIDTRIDLDSAPAVLVIVWDRSRDMHLPCLCCCGHYGVAPQCLTVVTSKTLALQVHHCKVPPCG